MTAVMAARVITPVRMGEFDFTRGSGWMYAIDGDVYPGRSMSLYPVRPDMTIYLRFTLAYGKDIGGFMDDGAAYPDFRNRRRPGCHGRP